ARHIGPKRVQPGPAQFALVAIDQQRRADFHDDESGAGEDIAHGDQPSLRGSAALLRAARVFGICGGGGAAVWARRLRRRAPIARSTVSPPSPDTPEMRCTLWPEAFSSAARFFA